LVNRYQSVWMLSIHSMVQAR